MPLEKKVNADERALWDQLSPYAGACEACADRGLQQLLSKTAFISQFRIKKIFPGTVAVN